MIPTADEIELAGFASWPAFEQIEHCGWILRSAEGYTKRANSANPLVIAGNDFEDSLSYCERFYRERSQPGIFRLCSFVENVGKLDDYLTDRGYRYLDPVLVLGRELADVSAAELKLESEDRRQWLETFCEVSGVDPAKQAVHLRILERIKGPSLFTCRQENGQVMACGLGVIHEGLFGIFDIVTASRHRRLGHGSRLLAGMLAWARDNGAHYSYLQVTASNDPAIRLYEKLGYRRRYDYWYRKKELS